MYKYVGCRSKFGVIFFLTSLAVRKPETAWELRTKDKVLEKSVLRRGQHGSLFLGSRHPSHLPFKAENGSHELPHHLYSILSWRCRINKWTSEKPWSLHLTFDDLFKRKPRAYTDAVPSPSGHIKTQPAEVKGRAPGGSTGSTVRPNLGSPSFFLFLYRKSTYKYFSKEYIYVNMYSFLYMCSFALFFAFNFTLSL